MINEIFNFEKLSNLKSVKQSKTSKLSGTKNDFCCPKYKKIDFR